MKKRYHFGGYATRHDVQCSDGLTIRKGAFAGCNGTVVPIVYQHNHTNVGAVLGHGLLEDREDGVYIYGMFNDTPEGIKAQKLVEHGDITRLSIFANNLKEHAGNVMHGVIREVSLVLAGANPGAYIDAIGLEHSANGDFSADIYNWEDDIETDVEFDTDFLKHSDEDNKMDSTKLEEVLNSMTPEQLEAVDLFLSANESDDNEVIEHAESSMKNKTIGDILDTFNDEQMKVLQFLMAKAAEDAMNNKTASQSAINNEGEDEMKKNVFDNGTKSLSHAEEFLKDPTNVKAIVEDMARYGTLKKSFIAHAETIDPEYGITNIDWLMPEFQNVNGNGAPGFIKTMPDAWVNVVMNGVHHTPFAKVKMLFADIREDDSRARGYMKGKYKKEEVFSLLKRQISPQMVYKKHKLDREDIIQITSFDLVAWVKGEMRLKLDEELARAFLFGDGRSSSADDKIRETNIIPVVKDEDLYCIKKTVTASAGEDLGHAIITTAVKAQDDYEGSGNITAFLVNTVVSSMLLLEDKNGNRQYRNIDDLANAMGVNKIVKVPASVVPTGGYGVLLDLNDYNVGADKGGSINLFEDFDIDYNQEKYLIETMCSGGLIKPYSAIYLKASE